MSNSPDMKEYSGRCMRQKYSQRQIKCVKSRFYRVLQSTIRGRNLGSNHIQKAQSDLTTVQLHESLLGDIESRAGSIDGDDVDRGARGGVGQLPARAAVGRVPDDVERAAEEREYRDVAECGEASR